MATLAAPAPDTTLDIEARNEVVLQHYPMVERLANRVASRYGMPTGMEVQDLVSYGVLGLVEAFERFDDSRGVPFESYAMLRVKGAIVDAIRQVDWVPRKVRARARRIDEATAKLTSQLGRTPHEDEVAESVGDDAKAKRRTPIKVLALESAAGRDSDGGYTVVDTLEDDSAEIPGWAMEDAETRRALIEAVNRLQERERLILTLYYFQGVPLTDIAKVLNVTESRVSQLHMRALQRVRERVEDV